MFARNYSISASSGLDNDRNFAKPADQPRLKSEAAKINTILGSFLALSGSWSKWFNLSGSCWKNPSKAIRKPF